MKRTATTLLSFVLVLLFAGSLAIAQAAQSSSLSDKYDGLGDPGIPFEKRHVLMLHVDAARGDLFRYMLEAGQLPNFEYLLRRGKISYNVSTVDKSETMKVLHSYLSSRLDTSVVGWWQFSRDEFRFKNFWTEPAEVINYALGLQFPRHPTLLDLLYADGKNTMAGFTTARRGVPFENYGRNYLEGLRATEHHTYHEQANSTMAEFIEILERIARNSSEKLPSLSHVLLAPADEFGHEYGVTIDRPISEFCFDCDSVLEKAFFGVLNDDPDHRYGGTLEHFSKQYFTRLGHGEDGVNNTCIALPHIPTHGDIATGNTSIVPPVYKAAAPRLVLALIHVDIQLGYLINALRSIRFDSSGNRYYQPQCDLPAYMASGKQEDSFFERTLIIAFGDHGMVDSKHMMGPSESHLRSPGSIKESFIQYLNRKLSLRSVESGATLLPTDEIGIEYSALPDRLAAPYRHKEWQSMEIRALTYEAEQWSLDFFQQLKKTLRSELYKEYSWLHFLKYLFIGPRLNIELKPHEQMVIDKLAQLYLYGEQHYIDTEWAANRVFYDQHVRLVYGGGARNNAEIFLPVCDQNGCSWNRRPSLEEILAFRGGQTSKTSLLHALRKNPGVGLIFIRKNNHVVTSRSALPGSMDILVMDRFGNTGTICVRKDPITLRLIFGYSVDPSSPNNPLGEDHVGSGLNPVWGTYHEWNDASVYSRHFYHNVVAGIGTYLYSNNPAIGDVLVMHNSDWNFGDNAGGHGGVHRQEKLTMMLVSGPGVGSGELKSRPRFRTFQSSTIDETTVKELGAGSLPPVHPELPEVPYTVHPTLLDITPTALGWLGYPNGALDEFARNGRFAKFLEYWTDRQQNDILNNISSLSDIHDALELYVGISDFPVEDFLSNLERLFQFISPCMRGPGGLRGECEKGSLALPDFKASQIDGNTLILE